MKKHDRRAGRAAGPRPRERGLLDRTLVVLASEFGRDAVTEGKVGKEVKDQAINMPDVMTEPRHYGMHRHFTAAGSVLMFGGGVKKGFVYGKTADERPCTTIEHPIGIEDLHATIYPRARHSARHRLRRREAARLRHARRHRQAASLASVRLRHCAAHDQPPDASSSHGRGRGRRSFSPILLGAAGQGRHEDAGHGHRRLHLRGRSTTGAGCRQAQVGQHARRGARTRRATCTCTTPSTRRARAPTRSSSSTAKGNFVRSWGKEFRGVAHGLHIRREGKDEFLYLTANAANPKMTPQPGDAGGGRQDDAEGRDRLEASTGPPDVDGYKPAADGTPAPLQPDQRRDRAERRRLRRRRLRLVLHQPVQRARRAHPDLRRPRLRAGQADRAARHLDGHARRDTGPRRRRSPQQPAAALHAGRAARRLRPRLPAAVPLRRAQGPGRRSRPARPRHAARQAATRSSRTSATRRIRSGTTRCAASRARSSSPASSSARTAPASTTTATSSSSSGSRSGG